MRIALDVMGADAPPQEIVRGGVQAAEANSDIEVILVGESSLVEESLKKISPSSEAQLSVRHADDVIGMDESPGKAVRGKPNSSLCQAVDMVAHDEADAIVSPGNTGAVVAAAMLLRMGLLEGVKRPGIAVTTRNINDGTPTTIIDCGATLSCKPVHLYQYAVMASIYQSHVLGTSEPSVGLLSVGEEDSKGSPLVKGVSRMLTESRLNFIGNVEGGATMRHECNVVVCDGFVGNAVLKAVEAVGETFINIAKAGARESLRVRIGLWLARSVLREMRGLYDFERYGGAPLLGVDGTVLICHGRSGSRAIRNAVCVAADAVRSRVNEHIVSALAEVNATAPHGSAVGNTE